MAAPTAEELLDLHKELNDPSARTFRAALLKKGFKVRLVDVEKCAVSNTGAAVQKASSVPRQVYRNSRW